MTVIVVTEIAVTAKTAETGIAHKAATMEASLEVRAAINRRGARLPEER